MPNIEIIKYDESEGRLREIYDDLIEKRGKLADVHTMQSLNPESIVHHMDLYMGIMFGRSPLKRYQREMIAVVVSIANKCDYCQIHHSAALQHFWKDDARIDALKDDFNTADLCDLDRALCLFADNHTRLPGGEALGQSIDMLKSLGISDRGLLDANLIVAYFNFVNRMVLGVGLNIEEEAGVGYNYD